MSGQGTSGTGRTGVPRVYGLQRMTFTGWLVFGAIALYLGAIVVSGIRDTFRKDSLPQTAQRALEGASHPNPSMFRKVVRSLGSVLVGAAVFAFAGAVSFSVFTAPRTTTPVTFERQDRQELSSFTFGDYSVYLEDDRVRGIEGPFSVVVPAVRGGRTGAICLDGWRSSATGSGACSHHGGVSHWTTRITEPERTETQNGVVCSGVEDGPWSLRTSLDDRVPHCWSATMDAYESNAELEAVFAELAHGIELAKLKRPANGP